MLPKNFNFYVFCQDDIKKYEDSFINYVFSFTHPWDKKMEEKYVNFNMSPDIFVYDYHDAYTKEHKEMGLRLPDSILVNDIIEKSKKIKERIDTGEPISVGFQCSGGISRSTAAAFIFLCCITKEWDERDCLAILRNKKSDARPNPLMIKIADSILQRSYKMVSLLDNHLDSI